jgi:hypothetical protein
MSATGGAFAALVVLAMVALGLLFRAFLQSEQPRKRLP